MGPAFSLAYPISTAAEPAPSIAESETVWITLAEPAVSFVYRFERAPAEDRAQDPDGAGFAALNILRQHKWIRRASLLNGDRPPHPTLISCCA